jgi:hypothetical protein
MRENLIREELEDGLEETQPSADRRPSAADEDGLISFFQNGKCIWDI